MRGFVWTLAFSAAVAGWVVPTCTSHTVLPPISTRRASAIVLATADDDAEGSLFDGSLNGDVDEFERKINEFNLKTFNEELYSHLSKRPEYETSELYSALRKRVDVDDPLYSELKARRERVGGSPMPSPTQTPGEVIELVLRALRDVDWPTPGHGIEMLQNYSSPASIINDSERRTEVTPQMLMDYFLSSKYGILLDWVSIQYTRKLELSYDKRRALQQLRLTSASGESVPVTFQLSKQTRLGGDEIWLIDQLLVKS